jgi:hypothetical protein
LNDPRVLFVKYEELLPKPSSGLTRMFDFLGFDCDQVSTMSKSINPNKMNRWKQTLTQSQISMFEGVVFDALTFFDFEIMSKVRSDISWYHKLSYQNTSSI